MKQEFGITCKHAEDVGVCSKCYEDSKEQMTMFPALEEALARIRVAQEIDEEKEYA